MDLVGLHKPELEKQATTQKSTLQGQRTIEDTLMFNCKHLIAAAEKLRDSVNSLTFSPPVTHVYNPLDYAWESHKLYLTKYGNSTKKVVMLGMNPGPFGMAQTGVPFGEEADSAGAGEGCLWQDGDRRSGGDAALAGGGCDGVGEIGVHQFDHRVDVGQVRAG